MIQSTMGSDSVKNALRIIIISFSVLAAALCVTAYASTLDSVTENMDTQMLSVSGSGLTANDKILIEVFNYDDESIDYDTELEGIGAAQTDENGSYTVSFKLPSRVESGVKLVAVKPLVGKYAEETLDFYSSKSINTILSNWNQAIENNASDKMEAVINDETALKIILNTKLAPTLAAELKDVDKTPLTAKLLGLSTAVRIDDFADDFILPYVNFALNNLSSDTASKLVLEFYDKIDTVKGKVYNDIILKMSDSEKLTLFAHAADGMSGELSNAEFTELVYENAVFDKLMSISYYSEIKPFVDSYNSDYFKIDFQLYDKLKSTYEVDSKVLNNRSEYTDFGSFKAKYEGWIKERYDEENKPSGGSVGSVSSGKTSSKRGAASGGGAVAVVKETVFDDIEGYEWAEEHILALYNKGVIDGTAKKQFSPQLTVTREQFVKMASALCSLPDEISDAGFDDVQKGAWYERYVNGAKQIGMISGKSEELFGIGESITRQDAAVILFNALKAENPEAVEGVQTDKLEYKDAGDISSYALYAVSTLSKLGVLNGDTAGNFMPTANATRAEAAVMINKVLNLMG